MKIRSVRTTAVILCLLAPALCLSASEATLHVHLSNFPDTRGSLAYALFNEAEPFPQNKEKAFKRGFVKIPDTLELDLRISDLPEGEYALSLYQDRNENSKLDKNFLGMPLEPIGFSQNPKIFMRAPSFKDAAFRMNNATQTLIIKMIH